jgi:hypothetical protein
MAFRGKRKEEDALSHYGRERKQGLRLKYPPT